MERYFEGTPPTARGTVAADRPGRRRRGRLIPIVCVRARRAWAAGAARRHGLCVLCRRRIRHARPPRRAEEIEVKADPAGPLVAQVFKTRIDPFVQKLSFIRVFSGTLKKDATVPVVGAQGRQDGASCWRCRPTRPTPVDEAGPGDIVAVAKIEDLHTGTVLGDFELPPIAVPHADGRPGRHAQEPRRRSQALRRVAQDRRGRSRPSAAIATRRPRKWSSPA